MLKHKIGHALGVTWTAEGCSLIQIRCVASSGKGKISIDGDIGFQFLEALEKVINLINKRAEIDLSRINLKICIPTPIDGPSAMLPLYLSIYSSISKKAIDQLLAFTGELNLKGEVVRVGEIESKLKAASRANLKGCVLPIGNIKELPSYIDSSPWKKLFLSPVRDIDEVLALALI